MNQASAGPLGTGKDLLRGGRFEDAVRTLKKAVYGDPRNPEAHYFLSLAFYRLGVRENSRPMLLHAEEAVRKALNLRPAEVSYHDHLIAVSSKLDRLSALSSRYRELYDKNGEALYSHLLKKIAAISIARIPGPAESKNKKGIFLLRLVNYVAMPLSVAAGITAFFTVRFRQTAPPLLAPAFIYTIARLSARPKSGTGKDW